MPAARPLSRRSDPHHPTRAQTRTRGRTRRRLVVGAGLILAPLVEGALQETGGQFVSEILWPFTRDVAWPFLRDVVWPFILQMAAALLGS